MCSLYVPTRGWQISKSLIIFIMLASTLINFYAELMHAIASCQSGNTASKAVDLLKKITIHSDFFRWKKNILFLLEYLFWFTWQHSRISLTCGTGNDQCKFRQNIKWFGLKIEVLIRWVWNVSSIVFIHGADNVLRTNITTLTPRIN